MSSRILRAVVSSGLAIALLTVGAGAAQAHSHAKPYAVTITPETVAAGSKASFTAHLSVPYDGSKPLGSADLTAPAGFTVVSASVAAPATATVALGAR